MLVLRETSKQRQPNLPARASLQVQSLVNGCRKRLCMTDGTWLKEGYQSWLLVDSSAVECIMDWQSAKAVGLQRRSYYGNGFIGRGRALQRWVHQQASNAV